MKSVCCLIATLTFASCHATSPETRHAPLPERRTMTRLNSKGLEQMLIAQHGSTQRERIHRGVAQVLATWRAEDGDAKELTAFIKAHFISDTATLQATAQHLEHSLEMLDGHSNEVGRELSRFTALEEGPLLPVDPLLAAYSPTAHITEDLFKSKIAFVVLLNFPLTTLEQRLQEGRSWSRDQWALARLTGRFEHRVPSPLLQEIDRVNAAAENYIDNYNIQMGSLSIARGKMGFAKELKLISHWGLRDEIRALYGQKDSLYRQRLIATIMERIIRQEIPRAIINSNRLIWDPVKNLVREPSGKWISDSREPDTRYARFLDIFRALQKTDPYYPTLPTHIDRVFSREREISEERMRRLLTSVLSSPTAQKVGALITQRLGRPLESFDLWYPGFKPQGSAEELALDRLTTQRYPTVKHFQDDIPQILRQLGFSAEVAAYLQSKIQVDPSRGAGHALGAKFREGKAHLRTRVGKAGMNYKGFNIAIHELGHNVEQVFSMSRVDHTLLEGVPNTGFTEAFAFLFQARDLELLGQANADPQAEALKTLDRFWSTFEIAGVAYLDLEIWRWLYRNPDATPARLRGAVVKLAQQVWNKYYAPVLGMRDVILPAIYSHIIGYGLYTPDYPLGYLITFQLEQYLKTRQLGTEMERMCTLGRLAPDIWMQQAVGAEVSSSPLLQAAEAAVDLLSSPR